MSLLVCAFLLYPPTRWAFALAWTAWISVILVQSEAKPIIDIGVRPAPYSLERDMVFTFGHMVAFTIVTGLWWWVLSAYFPLPKALITAMVIALVVGGITEYMQTFSVDRHPSMVDFLANCAGAFAAAVWVVRRNRKQGTSAVPVSK